MRLLIVEDSPTVREFLIQVLSADPALQVVGTAANGEEALAAVLRLKPDVVTMDIVMPGIDGLEATRRIMETAPTPIVIVSAQLPGAEAQASFQALQAGALAVVRRPAAVTDPAHDRSARDLVRTVKLMAEVKVVRRWPKLKPPLPSPASSRALSHEVWRGVRSVPAPPLSPAQEERAGENRGLFLQPPPELIAIGGSTGAPAVLQTILARLPAAFPLPILVVQHMTPGFIDSFAQWLDHASSLSVRVASQGQLLRPATVYVAPDACHLDLHPSGRILLSAAPPENGLRPAVNFLFRSLALSFGARAIGVLLSGMGTDGAAALKLLRDKGALTIVQDQESSIVHGMPGEAIRLGAAALALPPDRIASLLLSLGECVAAANPSGQGRSAS